jgi:hypothetical protein
MKHANRLFGYLSGENAAIVSLLDGVPSRFEAIENM